MNAHAKPSRVWKPACGIVTFALTCTIFGQVWGEFAPSGGLNTQARGRQAENNVVVRGLGVENASVCREGDHELFPGQTVAICSAECSLPIQSICPRGPKCALKSGLENLGPYWLSNSAMRRPVMALEWAREISRESRWSSGHGHTHEWLVYVNESLDEFLPKRARIKRKMLGRCALVGNSGILNHLSQGKQIDKYERVIRTNLAPVAGFEKKVGRRIDIDIVNGKHFTWQMLTDPANKHWLRRFLQHGTKKVIIYFADTPQRLENYGMLRQSFPHLRIALANYPDIVNLYHLRCDQIRNIRWGVWDLSQPESVLRARCHQGFNVGSLAVQLSSELCDSVSLFGFFPFTQNWVTNEPVGYHYWAWNAETSKHLEKPHLSPTRGSIGFELELAMSCVSKWRCDLHSVDGACQLNQTDVPTMAMVKFFDRLRRPKKFVGTGDYHIETLF